MFLQKHFLHVKKIIISHSHQDCILHLFDQDKLILRIIPFVDLILIPEKAQYIGLIMQSLHIRTRLKSQN